METHVISSKEQTFILSYVSRLNELQEKQKGDQLVYCRIPLQFCTKHNLLFLNLIFHKLSVDCTFAGQIIKPKLKEIKEVLKTIIEFELSEDKNKCQLSSEELHSVIKTYDKI